MSTQATRRSWVINSLGIAVAADVAAAWQVAHDAVHSEPPATFTSLRAVDARDIEAITAQIIPSDESPGAREAGVIYFVDQALGSWEADKRSAYRRGLRDVRRLNKKMFPTSTNIASLEDAQVRQLITAFENTEFFELLRTHTVLGFLGSPTYGGNRGKVGWAHIGLEDRMAFDPPFGYYDAEALKGG
jgi:gluconate 2-dehydrogenase gamma chain